ncbi:MAG: MarR family transcriptional regulator [Betaproteobacteria bacterium]|nr:MAG: MarR family transcriptional regulator [Betaproteobacteria bacterium]
MQATIANPAALLFPASYRRRVLALLLLHPERALHVREIARLTGTTPGTLNKELVRLHGAGLLERERVGNQVRYAANSSNAIYPELASILRKTVGVADVLADALAPVAASIAAAFVFGSVARGTETAGSDVDVLLIGSLGFGEAVKLLYPAQTTFGREIDPKVFTVAEWRSKLKSKDPFVKDVLAKPKIHLIGNDDELAKLGRRQP